MKLKLITGRPVRTEYINSILLLFYSQFGAITTRPNHDKCRQPFPPPHRSPDFSLRQISPSNQTCFNTKFIAKICEVFDAVNNTSGKSIRLIHTLPQFDEQFCPVWTSSTSRDVSSLLLCQYRIYSLHKRFCRERQIPCKPPRPCWYVGFSK